MRRHPRAWRSALGLVAGVLIVSAGVAGCSAGGKNASSSGAADRGVANQGGAAQGGAAQGGAGQNPQGSTAGGATGKAEQAGAAIQRSIIYTGSITVRVPDVAQAAGRLETIVAAAGGYIGGDDRQIDSTHSRATITLRVPAERYTSVLDQISGQWHEESRSTSAQDVTQNVIDLNARIQSQQASVNRIRTLLASAQSLTDITTIESELTKREADLESLQAQRQRLTDLSALSTITATLIGPDAVAAPAKKKAGNGGFLSGLRAGWHGFVATMRVLLTIVGALLPFLIAAAVVAVPLFYLLRRRRSPKPTS